MTHKNSPEKHKKRVSERKIRYALKTYINQQAKRDPIWAETVCVTDRVTLRGVGYSMFGENFSTSFIPDVEMGIVLTDSRGRGAFQ